MHSRSISAVMLLVAGAACAGRTPATSAAPATGEVATTNVAPVGRNRDIITREELTTPSVAGMTVLEAVKSLRPHFLTVRGTSTVPAKDASGRQVTDQESGKVHASVDGGRIVGIEELSGIRAGTIVEVQFLNPAAAMQKFGGSSRQGPVILVKTM